MHLRKVNAAGLRDVEDVGIAETEQGAGVLLGDVLLGFLVLLAANAHDGGKDANALGSGIHAAAQVLPRPEPGHAGGGRHLPRDLQHVSKAVVVEAAHGREVVGEGVGVSGLQLLNQELDVGGDEFLFGGGLLAVERWCCRGWLRCSWWLAPLRFGFGVCTSALNAACTCRTPPGEGGGSKAQGEGSPHPWSGAGGGAERTERSGGLHKPKARKIGEAPCAARSGQSP